MRRALVAAVALVLASSGASAHPGASWVPTLSIDPSSLPTIEGTSVPRAGDLNAGFALEWFDDPVHRRVDERFVQALSAQVGLPGNLALGFQLPVVGFQSTLGAGETPPGVGDVRALLRWAPRPLGSTLAPTIGQSSLCGQGRCSHNWDVGFALSLAGTAPTSEVSFAGHGAPTARLDATFEVRSYRYGAVASVGYLAAFGDGWPTQAASCGLPDAPCLANPSVRDRLIVSVGVRHPIAMLLSSLGGASPGAAAFGTIITFLTENTIGAPYLTFVASLDARDPGGSPAAYELGFGSQRRIGSFTITAGGACGFGSLLDDAFRVTVGLQWQPQHDEDRDGLGDATDQCLGVPGPRVTHGCPDEHGDPDHDGVRFPADQCPTLAEDRNGVADDDGCPDADSDGDRVPDARDACPHTAAGPRMAREPERRGCPFTATPTAPASVPADAGAAPVDAASGATPVEGTPYSNEAH